MPELAALLPPEAPPQARPFSLGGLQGQQARATVYIEEILLPQVQDGLQSRPKAAVYHATYRSAPASNYLYTLKSGCTTQRRGPTRLCVREQQSWAALPVLSHQTIPNVI